MTREHSERGFRRALLPIWLALLCVFLLLGGVYRLAPQQRSRIQPFFPLLSGLSSRLDETAEQLKAGKPIAEAVGTFFHGIFGNVETNPY